MSTIPDSIKRVSAVFHSCHGSRIAKGAGCHLPPFLVPLPTQQVQHRCSRHLFSRCRGVSLPPLMHSTLHYPLCSSSSSTNLSLFSHCFFFFHVMTLLALSCCRASFDVLETPFLVHFVSFDLLRSTYCSSVPCSSLRSNRHQ
jgi:hypothetical protein